MTGTERDEAVLARYRAGDPLRTIAQEHGISAERVRQIAHRAGEPPRRAPSNRSAGTKKKATGERVRLRIGNLAKAVLVTGQAYQDPKDALNEFVSNAADEYAEAGERGGRIRVVLRRKGRSPMVAVDDDGRGMGPDRLREIARNLFESAKAGDDRTLGEKAIGLLGFQQLGARCEIISRAEGSEETWRLSLERGTADANLSRERRRARQVPGTTVYLSQLDPEVLRMLTQRKVVDYLRRRRGAALERGDYSLEVVEGRTGELVTPDEPEGVRLALSAQNTLWGRIEFAIYVAPDLATGRRVAVVGRAGTTIIDDLAELEEFDHVPWTSGQVSGQIVFEALQQSAGRRAVLRDRDAFPVFREAVTSIEPAVARAVERVRREVDEATADRLSETVRRVFGRVLKELADLENPMRTPVGDEPGEGGLFEGTPLGAESGVDAGAGPASGAGTADQADPREPDLQPEEPPPVADLLPDQSAPRPSSEAAGAAHPKRSRGLPSLAVDPEPGPARSRFDSDEALVLYNDRHPDYLLVKDDEPVLLDYLATLVAKEYVVYNNPLASSEDLAEEMVRMLVRVRRHLPRRR